MVKHVVLFKLKPFAEGNSKHENALYLKEMLMDLSTVIPQLIKIEVIVNIPEVSPENYDLMLITEFKSIDDLKSYANHPDHLKVVSFISKVIVARAAIDFEV